MARLGQSLFLRELERRDLNRQRRAQEQQRATEAGAQALESAENARDRAMERKLKQAQIEGMQASALGEMQPEYKEAPISEMGRLGFRAGEVKKQERSEAEAAKRAFAELTQEGKMAESEYEASQRKALEELKGKQSLEEKTSLQESLRKSIEKESSRERALRRELAGQRERQPSAALQKEITESEMTRGNVKNIRMAASYTDPKTGEVVRDPNTGKIIVDYDQFLSPGAKNKMMEYNRKLETGGPGILTSSEQADYKKKSEFRSRIGLVRAQLTKELIGVGQSAQEADRLVDALISYDMNGPQFAAALAALEDEGYLKGASARRQAGIETEERGEEDEFIEASPGEGQPPGEGAFAGSFYRKVIKMLRKLPIVGPAVKEEG